MSSKNHDWIPVVTGAAAIGAAGYWLGRRQSDSTTIPLALHKSPHSKQLQLAVHLAKKAGYNMSGYLEGKGTSLEKNFDLDIETKSNTADFCTKVDVMNEILIMEGIQAAFPGHDIIGEETVGTGELPPLRRDVPTWIIDPIDGTTNFSAGIHSMTCVSIGYCENGTPVVGVIYAPGTKELYIGVKDHGAYRNGIKIQKNRPAKSLQEAVVCCEFGYARDKAHVDKILEGISKIMLTGCRAIRQLGSGCLDLCMVASGRLDVVYAGLASEGWKPWDYAAGWIICKEAGCVMESFDQEVGKDFDIYSKSIICGVSRELVDDVRKTLLSK